MTVSSTTNRKEYAGNGATLAFATSPVVFFDAADLTVYQVVDATGVATTKTLTTHYTVSGGSGAVGTVTMLVAPPTGTTLVIVRDLAITQASDFVQNDGSDAEVSEDALDRLTMIAQQLDARIDRKLGLADSDTSGATMEIPTAVDRASKTLGFDADGEVTVYDPASAVTSASNVTVTASGTGGSTRTVSAALAAMVRRGDFDTLGHYNTGVAALTERIGVAALDITKVVTDSSVGNNTLTLSTTDTSPPVGAAGILNTWFAPAYRFDIISQAGTTTGSHAGMLIYMPSVKGKSSTTLGQAITASGSPQSVIVGDSSIFPSSMLPLTALIGSALGSSVSETVTVTAVADSTHITAIFSNNHSSGELVLNNFMGVKNALGIAISDQAGNTNDVFAMNPNVTAVSSTPGHNVIGSELDVTNSTGVNAAKFQFDILTGGPLIGGEDIIAFGSKKITYLLSLTSGDSVCQAWNALKLEGAGVNAITITNGGNTSLAPTAAIRIQSATTYGVIIGKNQTAATNSVYTLTDPTHAVYLTAKGTSGSAASNLITLESLNAGVSHTFSLRHQNAAGGLFFDYDGATNGNTFIGTDGSINAGNTIPIQVRDAGAVVRATFSTSGSAAALTEVNSGTLTITATTINITSGGSTTISTGVGSVKMSSANAATNTAWIPIKYAGTTYFVPGWTTNSP